MVLAQNVPMDIIREIFKYFSTPLIIPIPDSGHELEDKKSFPWYLSHICSLWRTSFFSMYSEFWSTITIHAHHRYPHSAWEKAVSMAKVFLERTEGRPFSFSVDAKYPCPPILDLFIAESTRWKCLSLCLNDDDENIPLFWSIKNRIPQLCLLALDNAKLGIYRDFPLIFEDVPALTHLSLIRLGNWYMDWSLLTELELSRECNIDRLLRVLSQTTNLERLALNKPGASELGKLSEESFDPVTLPRLRTLEIIGLPMLHFLTTPALQGLCVFNPGKEPVHESCASFFTRSSCQLQRFGALLFWPPELADILSYMPDLKVLTVPNALGMPEILEAMTCRTGERTLIPQLRVLRLSRANQCWCFDDTSTLALRKLLESRVSNRFLHLVQELKVIVICDKSSRQCFKCLGEFKHSNVQSRRGDFSCDMSAQSRFQWLCDDLEC